MRPPRAHFGSRDATGSSSLDAGLEPLHCGFRMPLALVRRYMSVTHRTFPKNAPAGIALQISATFFFAIMSALVRFVADDVPSG